MGAKTVIVRFFLFISLGVTTVLAESPPVDHCVTTPKPSLCPQNEERRCRNPCPPETCLTLYADFDCIQNQTCVNGCYCKKGFLRVGQKGPCVPKDQCNPLECVNDPNAQKGCGDKCGKTCADYKTNPICPKRPCKNDGCECKEGYIYDQNLSLCVKPKDCTKPCKSNERYSTCLPAECGPKTCDDVGEALACPPVAADPCPSGCVCDYGYVKDKDGKCIDAKTCTSCGGDPNAQLGCGNPCGKTCASLNINKSELVCPQYCNSNGCDCKEGYLLNTDVKPPRCVLVKDCPKPPNKCGKNEEYYCGPSCPDSEVSCANPNPPTCINKRCELKCFCKKGFVRDANNTCIPANKCPNCTKPHERYIDCLAGQCNPKYCEDLGKSLACPFIRGPCPGGCMCEQGYLYNSAGECINQEKCPAKPCGRNETWMTPCNSPCPYPLCPRDDKPPRPCIDILPCYPGCQCKLNYLRNATGHCILAPDCPPVNCTRQNEVWDKCPSACLAEGCDDVNKQPTTCNTLVWLCSPRCVCMKGHFRNKDGVCVPASQCSAVPCTRPNEEYNSCPGNRITSCALLNTKPVASTGPKYCYPGCICKEGFYQNSNGTCVPKSECQTDGSTVPNTTPSVPRKCPANEVLKSRTSCPPDSCDTLYLSFLCIANQTETLMCTCKDGYLRTNSSATGVCVPQDRCLPPECADDPNAKRGCGIRCGKTCADYNDTSKDCNSRPVACHLYGCDCQDGFVYDENIKKCVKPNQCTKKCKKPHERYSTCLLGECVPKTCAQLGYPIACPRVVPPCTGGCICEEGYVKDSNGDCIEKNKCPSCRGDPNAVSGCGNPCGKTCDSLYQNKSDIVCPQYCEINGCDCKPGYLLLNADKPDSKKCVPEKECPKPKQCKGPHEKYIDCPAGQCNPKTCDDLVTPPGCPRIKPPCPGGCVCEDGYLRNSKGICMKKEQCPSLQCKKPHERYSNCLLGECVPKTCEDVGYPVACPDIIGPCAGGCTCEEGYVRDCNGDCIDMKKCPCCGGDPNAVSGCGNPCGKTCASLYANKSDLVCPQYCEYNGCDCKPGFLLLESNNTDSSKCVPEQKCPKPPQQCGENEQYYCGTSCPEATCANPKPPTCVNKKCKLACFCKNGFVRNANNKCVPVENCPAKCKGAHEKYIDCPAGQCNAKTCKDLITPPPCPRIIPPCPGGCVCEDGYLRDPNGICIKKEQCPSVCKDPNASWKDCKDACPGTCQNTKPGCVNIMCSAGCQCNDGYVLSKLGGKCVKIEQCPDYADCGGNQTFVPCTFKCPQVMCPESDLTLLCKPPRDCPGGCGCKPYYRYNATGDCVKASDCPPVECTRPNEEWTSCQRISDWERCDDRYNTPPFNPGDADDCTPKCVCKKGYWRNDANDCVPEKECPPISG